MMNLKGDLLNKMKEHRDEYLGIFNQSEEERQRMERIKFEKYEADSRNNKQLLQNFEKKLESEAEFRQRSEDEIRRYLETKFNNMAEQLKSDEKLALEREKRMINQVQEGLVTMNEIIKGTKEQNLISLSHQQTLLSEQNKKLKEMVDNIQTSVFGRQQAIETELNDHRAKIQEIETVVVKSVTTANRTVESELGRFEKIISAFEKYIDTQIGDVKAQYQGFIDEHKAARGESFKELLRKQEDL